MAGDKPGDSFAKKHGDGQPEGISAMSDAQLALKKMFELVHEQRDQQSQPSTVKDSSPQSSAQKQIKTDFSSFSATNDAASQFQAKGVPMNYYDGKLAQSAGDAAASGLKSMFNQDRAVSILHTEAKVPSYQHRVDGLNPKSDAQAPSVNGVELIPNWKNGLNYKLGPIPSTQLPPDGQIDDLRKQT